MLTEKIARKSLSLGAYALKPGDTVPDDAAPLGRVQVLMDQGWISERPADSVDATGGLVDRIAELEARIAALEARRGPGRPRKDEV